MRDLLMFSWVFGMTDFLANLKIEFDNGTKMGKGNGAMNTYPKGGRARKEYRKRQYEQGAGWRLQKQIAAELAPTLDKIRKGDEWCF
jgi:hypothetical protein